MSQVNAISLHQPGIGIVSSGEYRRTNLYQLSAKPLLDLSINKDAEHSFWFLGSTQNVCDLFIRRKRFNQKWSMYQRGNVIPTQHPLTILQSAAECSVHSSFFFYCCVKRKTVDDADVLYSSTHLRATSQTRRKTSARARKGEAWDIRQRELMVIRCNVVLEEVAMRNVLVK